MKEFWDSRYSESGYAYGEQPNVFFADEIAKLPVGKLLLPAEGEGRNAIFAAKLGWEVDAIDQSEAGKNKALALAAREQVKINYQIENLANITLSHAHYDVAALIYAHFPPPLKTTIHHHVANAVKPGGYIILEGFSIAHIAFNSVNPKAGGPTDKALLFDVATMPDLFPGFKTLMCVETTTHLEEGKYHVGQSAVIRYIGQKH